MAGTKKQIESHVVKPKRRSLLRDERPQPGERDNDKRPAGPSSFADPGMGSPTRPLPPGIDRTVATEFVRHPKIAGSFRPDVINSGGLGPESADADKEVIHDH